MHGNMLSVDEELLREDMKNLVGGRGASRHGTYEDWHPGDKVAFDAFGAADPDVGLNGIGVPRTSSSFLPARVPNLSTNKPSSCDASPLNMKMPGFARRAGVGAAGWACAYPLAAEA